MHVYKMWMLRDFLIQLCCCSSAYYPAIKDNTQRVGCDSRRPRTGRDGPVVHDHFLFDGGAVVDIALRRLQYSTGSSCERAVDKNQVFANSMETPTLKLRSSKPFSAFFPLPAETWGGCFVFLWVSICAGSAKPGMPF